MKTKLKMWFRIIAIVVIVVLICILILAIPGAASKVASWTGTSVQKVKDTAVTIIGIGIGAMLISFGVTALAVPWVGIALIVVGLAILGWSLWTSGWFGNRGSVPINSPMLNKVA